MKCERKDWKFTSGKNVRVSSQVARGKDSSSSAGDAGDLGLILGLVRSPGGGTGNLLQYHSQENHMDRKAWQTPGYVVTKNGHS